jgi:hypothetical protein
MTATKRPASDIAAQKAVEGRTRAKSDASQVKRRPSAGPHADPALANPDATPGAGTLPEAGQRDADSNSG